MYKIILTKAKLFGMDGHASLIFACVHMHTDTEAPVVHTGARIRERGISFGLHGLHLNLLNLELGFSLFIKIYDRSFS